jgi:hypothetical protein
MLSTPATEGICYKFNEEKQIWHPWALKSEIHQCTWCSWGVLNMEHPNHLCYSKSDFTSLFSRKRSSEMAHFVSEDYAVALYEWKSWFAGCNTYSHHCTNSSEIAKCIVIWDGALWFWSVIKIIMTDCTVQQDRLSHMIWMKSRKLGVIHTVIWEFLCNKTIIRDESPVFGLEENMMTDVNSGTQENTHWLVTVTVGKLLVRVPLN